MLPADFRVRKNKIDYSEAIYNVEPKKKQRKALLRFLCSARERTVPMLTAAFLA